MNGTETNRAMPHASAQRDLFSLKLLFPLARRLGVCLLAALLYPALLPAAQAPEPLVGKGCNETGWCHETGFPYGFYPKAASRGRLMSGDNGLLLRRVGTTDWVRDQAPIDGDLRAVWFASDSDQHALDDDHLLHFDGNAWSDLTPPGGGNRMWQAFGGHGDVLYASGFWGGLASYHDGAWHRLDSGVKTSLTAISVLADGSAYLVGRNGVVLHVADGRVTPMPSGVDTWLTAVLARAPDDIWVGGRKGLLLHWDGKRWQRHERVLGGEIRFILPDPDGDLLLATLKGEIARYQLNQVHHLDLPLKGKVDLRALWRDDNGRLNALSDGMVLVHGKTGWRDTAPALSGLMAFDGGQLVACGAHGAVERFDGARWRRIDGKPSWMFSDLWGARPDEIYLVDVFHDGLVRLRGELFEKVAIPEGKRLVGVWGSGADDIFAVGEAGRVVHFDGHQWHEQDSGLKKHLMRVDGSGPNDVWAAGKRGALAHYDGTAWHPVSTPFSSSWYALDVVAPNDVYLAAWDQIVHFDGKTWSEIALKGLGFEFSPSALHGLAGGPLLVAGYVKQPLGSVSREGVVALYADGAWRAMRGVAPTRLMALARASDGALWAVGWNDTRAWLPADKAAARTGAALPAKTTESAPPTPPESAPAQATTASEEQEAERQAARAIGAGDFDSALHSLKRAQQLHPNPGRADRIRRIELLLKLRGK